MRASRGGGERGGLPCSFENRKKCPDFGKEGPYCVHLWDKFSIENVVLNRSALVPQTPSPLYSEIFRTLCNAYIRRNLAYSESWNIQNPSIIASRRIFRTLSYLRKFTNIQNSDIFKTPHIFRTLSKI